MNNPFFSKFRMKIERDRFLRIAITVLFVAAGFYLYAETAESRDKGPAQPVLFSHKIHAGDNQIQCQTCHSYTEVSPHPGIPSVQKCMGCHSYVAGRDVEYTTQGGQTINIREEINKVKGYWRRQEPIPWVKVTGMFGTNSSGMPEFVHFNHKRHIKRGFECSTCHGEVEKMDVVHKAKDLTMGFCISCHEENADNEEHKTELKDCLTCHY